MMERQAGETRRGGLSLDALVLVLVTGLTLHLNSFADRLTTFTTPALNAVAVGLLGLYLAVDVLAGPLAQGRAAGRRLFYGGKGLILCGIIGLAVIWPTCAAIGLRHAHGPASYVHDTSINVEAATAFLLQGKDPYAQTYFHTPLAQFRWDADHRYGSTPNPALWWTDTFPGQEEITVPFMLAARALAGWFDERFVFMAAFAVTLLFLLPLAPTPSTRLALLAAVALNPLWIREFIYGQNDILVLAELVAMLYFSLKGRWRLALVALALGCATKQTTLLLIPFYLWWLALRLAPTWPARLERLVLLLPWLAVPLILLVGPFVAWDPVAFYKGNFGYVAGTVPHSYPIQGYSSLGAASFVLWLGFVSGPNAYFPFSVYQAAVALPLAVLLLRRMRPATPATVMLGAYATVLLAVFYFSRFFHVSYAAFTISLLAIAYLAHRPARWRGDDGHLSFDVIALFLLVPQVIEPPTNRHNAITAAIVWGLLLSYLVVATLAPWPRLREGWPRRAATLARALVLAGLAEVAIVSRLVEGITNRLRWWAPFVSVHDTALQIQLSTAAVVKHRNPYTMSFLDTPLFKLYIPPFMVGKPLPRDLPLTHNPHLPLDILAGVGLQLLFDRLHLFFDEGYVYLLALLLLTAILPLVVELPARQLALLGTVVFSPLFASGLIFGQDDVLVLLALVVAFLLLQRRHSVAAALAAGIAVALKLTAWPLIPLFLVYVVAHERRMPRSWLRRALTWSGCTLMLAAPFLASALPYIRWNAAAFWNNAFAYPLGLLRDSLPLTVMWGPRYETLGFGRVALGFHWAHVNGAGYIGPWLAVGAGALVLGLLLVRLWRAPGLPLLMAGYLILLFTLEYFGRYMVDTSLGYLAVLAPLSFFLAPSRARAQAAPLPLPTLRDEPLAAVGGSSTA